MRLSDASNLKCGAISEKRHMEIVEKLASEQPEMTNAFIMAYAQYLLTKREAEA